MMSVVSQSAATILPDEKKKKNRNDAGAAIASLNMTKSETLDVYDYVTNLLFYLVT